MVFFCQSKPACLVAGGPLGAGTREPMMPARASGRSHFTRSRRTWA
ncbi:hypothetical protein AZ20_0015 [Bordetella bronchiseptica E014]|nr:hypothetical protein AZ20_0015 [Bordetella bronchiseptica E014]